MRLAAVAAATAALLAAPASAGIGYSAVMLWPCGSASDSTLEPYQHWQLNTAPRAQLQIVTAEPANQKLWGSSWCLATNGAAVVNASVWTSTCGGAPTTTFASGSPAPITFTASNLCLDVIGRTPLAGSGLQLAACTGGAGQQFTLNPSTGRVVHSSGLCLDSGSHHRPCAPGGPGAGLPFCNASLPLDARVADIVSRLSTTDKINMLDTSSGGAASLGVAPVQWWNEALHGVANNVGVAYLDPIKYSTSFPMPITTSCSFNRTLWKAIGGVISTEARAFANAGHAALTYWAPTMNMFRDPRWGRGQETPGEDVTVTSAYVANFVQGMQEGDDPRYLKVSSCIKHFAGYSLELWNGTDRHHFDAVISDADLVDYYLPSFQAGVEVGKASSMMCSYNAVNGVPSCANSFLINELARGHWGLDAYVTSDCGAVSDIPNNHHYPSANPSTSSVVAAVLKAGTDIGCDDFLVDAGVVQGALNDGSIAQADLDTAVAHLLRVRFRLGEFDPAAAQPYTAIGPEAVCTADNVALATDAARQAIVLLRNQGPKALPLDKATVKNIALVGPSADTQYIVGGPNYDGVPCGTGMAVTLQAALEAAPGVTVNFQQGCSDMACGNADIASAVAAASGADATVVTLGIDQTFENEGLDRTVLTAPGQQNALATAVCAAAAAKGAPCIVVVISGGAIDTAPVEASGNVTAVFYAGLLGGTGANALVELMFGDAAPAGRMTQTVYAADFVNQVSLFDMGIRPGPSAWPPGANPGRTYQFFTGTPTYPFGFGLSYTTWSVSAPAGPARLPLAPVRAYLARHATRVGASFASLLDEPQAAQYSVNVTNTGSVDSAYVVLGFVVPPSAGSGGVPLQSLFDFQRVFVPAGQSVTVFLGLGARQLTRVVDDAAAPLRAGVPRVKRVAVPGRYTVRVGVRAEGQEWAETHVDVA